MVLSGLLVVIALLLGGPAFAAAPQLAGEVARGETFTAPLCDDLVFELKPTSHGWLIWVGDPADESANYAAVRTPPFRGINALWIDGWHFRNQDNSGPNEAGPLNVNAPQHVRSFRFVTSRADYEAVARALDIVLWPGNWSGERVAQAAEALEAIPDAPGELTIDDLELGNTVVGEQAWIERMRFTLAVWNRCP